MSRKVNAVNFFTSLAGHLYYLVLVIFCLNSFPYRLWKDVNTGACQIKRESPLVFLDGGHLVLLLL